MKSISSFFAKLRLHSSKPLAQPVPTPDSSRSPNMSSSSMQYQVAERGAPFGLVNVSAPSPGGNEICIRAKAVGLNPLDWKSRNFGVMVQTWPAVFGVDAAGVVESVGQKVKNFKAGDEVLCLAGTDPRAGAFQEIITIPAYMAAKKPESLTFEEASSLPICYMTGAAGIVDGLGLPLPFLDPSASGTVSYNSVLVLGGSSGVGAAAIQMLRLALPQAQILTTSSTKHHDHLVALGASKAFERTASPADIKAATPGGAGVDVILDTVTAAVSQPTIFEVLGSSGPRIYAQVVTGQEPQIPEGVTRNMVFGRKLFGTKGGIAAIPALAKLIEDGKYKLPVKVEVAGKGYDAIAQGLDRLMKQGVSGSKLVVSL